MTKFCRSIRTTDLSKVRLRDEIASTPRRIREGRGAQRRSLHSATPDFLWNMVALVHIMRPSLRKGAHAAFSSATWQEIGYAPVGMTIHLGNYT